MRLIIDNKTYAAGLFWQPCAPQQKSTVLRLLGTKLGYDYACWRPTQGLGSFAQIGFGYQKTGLKWGLRALAVVLADQIAGSWIGAWPVGQQWWGISVREDLIETQGDQVFACEEEARDWVAQEVSRGAYLRMYVPTTWNYGASEDIPLQSLLAPTKSRLFFIKVPRRLLWQGLMMLSGLVGLLVLILQGLAYQAAKPQPVIVVKPTLAYVKRWQDHPLPATWLIACRHALSQVPAQLLGWQMREFNCHEQSASVDWIRDQSRGVMPSALMVTPQTTSAHWTIKLDPLKCRGNESLATPLQNTRHIVAHNLPVTLTVLPPEPPLIPEFTTQGLQPSWRRRAIVLQWREAPWDQIATLARLPGLVLHRLQWTVTNNLWQLEGVLYEQEQ